MPRAQEKQPEETPDQEPQQAEQPTPTETPVAGFILLGAILYFSLVWWNLPSGAVRWLVTGALAIAVTTVWVAARYSKRLRAKLERLGREFRRWGTVAGDFLSFLLVVVAIILAAVWLETEDQVVLLKVFTVLYFSLLPAVLYLQFGSRKTLTVWKEYVLNLYKLEADDPANLPRPPALSRFHKPWKEARDTALGKEPTKEVEAKLEKANIYRQKFRDLFGPVPSVETQLSVLSLRSAHKLQVLITTVLVTIGWVFVVQPETVFGRSYTPADFELANLPPIPRETFAFAFLGAYFYILQMLVRRYFQNDLKATAYINATMRIVIVILLVWTLDPLLDDATSQAERSAIAFVIGVFPTVGWQALQQLLRKPFGFAVPSLEPDRPYRLNKLDGLNIWYESRLLEVGIEDIQNLATTDIVDLMLNTRIPVDRLIDWIDQAFLYIRVTGDTDRETLRRYGIRSATDLLDVFKDRSLAEEYAGLLIEPGDNKPSRMRSLVAAIQTERNLQHVQAWKSFTVGKERPTPRARPVTPPEEAEAPPEPAPVPA